MNNKGAAGLHVWFFHLWKIMQFKCFEAYKLLQTLQLNYITRTCPCKTLRKQLHVTILLSTVFILGGKKIIKCKTLPTK